MVLVDSSVWIDHLRFAEPELERLLLASEVLGHSLVAGEVAMGSIKNRRQMLKELDRLPAAIVARDYEVRRLVESEKLYGRGFGYVDARLLVAVRLTPGAALWTRDTRLGKAAKELVMGFDEARAN